ncbi:MAG: PHP domain-containing protein [Vicinamibacterales bacterium]
MEPALVDTNALVAALLRDLAVVQTTRGSEWGYKGAASAVLQLEVPLEDLVKVDGALEQVPNIGPSSRKVILEVLATGGSERVERAVAASPKAADIARRRTLRHNFLSRAVVVATLARRLPRGPSRADYRGDLQMHSTWSDGGESIAELAAGCVDRGYTYCAITDHSAGLPIARGVSAERFVQQHREIDEVNRECAGRFHVFKGVETNIAADGSLDVPPGELSRFDIVLAAPHSKLRIADDQTARMVRAVSLAGVHVLAHPRGRMYGSRAGIIADWDRVFAVAAARHVAIEIDGDPSRQDLDYALAARALDAGCLLALDSDAHSTAELPNADWAIAHARLASAARDRIVNCWDVDRLREWCAMVRNQ